MKANPVVTQHPNIIHAADKSTSQLMVNGKEKFLFIPEK